MTWGPDYDPDTKNAGMEKCPDMRQLPRYLKDGVTTAVAGVNCMNGGIIAGSED